jgi:hypothetical protein
MRAEDSRRTPAAREQKDAMTRVRFIHAAWIVAMTVGFTGASCATHQPAGPEAKPAATPAQLHQQPASPAREPERPSNLKHQVTYSTLPLSFEANRGQTDQQVKFLSRGRGYSLFLTPAEAVLVVQNLQEKPEAVIHQPTAQLEHTEKTDASVLRMTLLGANPSPTVTGLDALPGKSHYLIGNDPKKWRTNVPTYAKVHYQNIYPGVDLLYYGNQRQLEYDFVVAPGADPQAITLHFEGADSLDVDAKGDLVLRTAAGELRLHKPLVYQETDGVRQEIAGGYVLKGKQQVSFQVAAYDASRPLVIDPVLSYSTYLGGSDSDAGYSIAVDSSGNAYVTGYTSAADFPTTNPLQPMKGGDGVVMSSDAFITKLNAEGPHSSTPPISAGVAMTPAPASRWITPATPT